MDNSFEKLINRVLDGRYRIENVLGIGGMAYVLKATDMQNGNRTVAIKILNDECNSDERAVKRFVNESEAVSMISAPNIVKIYDVAISDTLKYIVMEYIDGITLKDYIDKVGALGWKEAVHYVKQILSGLSAAHEKGIIHRDVKPQNVMLLKDGHVKVTDFGIAKMPTSEPITMTDKAIGTVNYISPEQASGGKVDFKSDLYSVGVMLYEMVTGRLPFTADSPVAVAMMQVSNEPVAPREINPSIPIGLEQIILKAMCKDPDGRFTSANAMIKALDYFVKNPTVVFAQPDNASQGAKNKPIDVIPGTDDGKNKKDKKKSKPMYPVILGITLAFFIVAIGTLVYLLANRDVFGSEGFSGIDKFLGIENNNSDDKKMTVESFIDRTYDEKLEAELKEKGYSVAKINYVRNELKPESCIINQDPEPGSIRIKPAQGKTLELTLYVNMGAVETKMPDCVLTDGDTAVRYLTNEFNSVLIDSYDGSNITTEEKSSDTVPKGFVIETDPAPGTKITVTNNIKIKLYVSTGPEKKNAIMPQIVGKTLDEARRLLDESGLSFGNTVNVDNDEYPAGYVVKASVAAGEEVEAGTTAVDVWVSRGQSNSGSHNNTPSDTSGAHNKNDNTQTGTNTGTSHVSGNNGENSGTQTPDNSETNAGNNSGNTSENQNGESSENTSDGGLDALLGLRGEEDSAG